jgi:transposase-like protein
MDVIEIMKRWPDQEAAIAHLERVRWGGRVLCPYCQSDKVCVHASKDKNMPRWQCEGCHRAFSATVGTIFHHTHLPLQTWFLAMALMLNAKKNVSNAQLGRDLNLPYKTVWFLALRIRGAMMTDPEQKRLFQGIVEMDETYVGGKPRKGNGSKATTTPKSKFGRGTDKMAVVGIVERNGRAVAQIFNKADLTFKGLSTFYRSKVDAGAAIAITDEASLYSKFREFTQHFAVNHKEAYAVGDTHTNTMEGFWALIKRSWYGQHHTYSQKWGDFYITEVAYKYNNRHNGNPFGSLMRHMAGVAA